MMALVAAKESARTVAFLHTPYALRQGQRHGLANNNPGAKDPDQDVCSVAFVD